MSENPQLGQFGAILALKSGGRDDVEIDLWFHLRSYLDRLKRPWTLEHMSTRAEKTARRAARTARRVARWPDDRIVARARSAAKKSLHGLRKSRHRAICLGCVAEMTKRRLSMTPHHAQLVTAALLLDGALAELETGSGKTLASGLAASVAALTSQRVHLITANDYLAARDLDTLKPLYKAFGLSTGLITDGEDTIARFASYRADILHASGKELAFDYLRNRILLGAEAGPVQLALRKLSPRGAVISKVTFASLPFAIVDEADSVLIDESRTPLIISRLDPPDPTWAREAVALAADLEEDRDYTTDTATRTITLTPEGKSAIGEAAEGLGGIWHNPARREHTARLALTARHFYARDEHYIVTDDRIELIDEYSGRVAEGRALGDGLHQIVEYREGVPVTGRRVTEGRITYQRLFRRYQKLSGMTGTASEVATELRDVYDLTVVPVRPPHRSRRKTLKPTIAEDEPNKWAAVAMAAQRATDRGRPVLIATRTIRASVAAAEALNEAGVDHVVLNAAQSADEAEIVAKAGQPGHVTIATNMAGRGVDIPLPAPARRAGGLHIILTELHEAGRIDRQVYGRTARQGDPGSVQTILSWSDSLLEAFGDTHAAHRIGGLNTFLKAQRNAEKNHALARLDLLRHDMQRDRTLSFAGASE